MSVLSGFTIKFEELCGEICALRDRVESLEESVASLKIQTAASARPATSTPPPAAPARASAATSAKSATK